MALEPGQVATVRVAVATLWADPSAVRPVDATALAVPSDARRWVSGMSTEERVHEGVLTQLLLAERVRAVEERDGWVRVVALDQPAAKLDPAGYPGWLPAAQLAPEESAVDGVPYVVDATATALRDSPSGDVVMAGVVLGTRLAVIGSPRRGRLPVRVPGIDEPLWTLARDVVPLPTEPPDAADVLAVARRLLDVPYVWGGLSAHGIDCSGLVHLSYRRFGVRVPRDADDQFDAATPVPADAERPGDLYFFARHGGRVHHVGFVADAAEPAGAGRRMVHACSVSRQVRDEPMSGDRAGTLVAARQLA